MNEGRDERIRRLERELEAEGRTLSDWAVSVLVGEEPRAEGDEYCLPQPVVTAKLVQGVLRWTLGERHVGLQTLHPNLEAALDAGDDGPFLVRVRVYEGTGPAESAVLASFGLARPQPPESRIAQRALVGRLSASDLRSLSRRPFVSGIEQTEAR